MKKYFFISLLLTCLATQFSFAQFRLMGMVKDAKNIPISGVVISIENTQLQVISDIDGIFILSLIHISHYREVVGCSGSS